MEGYGDLRQNSEEAWMALFGTFSYTGDFYDTEWLKEEVSVSINKTYDIAAKTVRINGGVSRYSDLPEGVYGILLDDVVLDNASSCTVIDGQISVLGDRGERHTFQLSSGDSCSGCAVEQSEICWDLSGFTQVDSW